MIDVNKVMPVNYPIPGDTLLDWSEDLDRLRPDVTSDQLRFLFDCFKLGKIEFDKRKGIQNIFEGLHLIEKVDGFWRIIEQWPG